MDVQRRRGIHWNLMIQNAPIQPDRISGTQPHQYYFFLTQVLSMFLSRDFNIRERACTHLPL